MSVPAVLLRDLQVLLGGLYGLELSADVRDYVITSSSALQSSATAAGVRDMAETLLIEEGDGEISLALYLDPAVLDRLDQQDPLRCLCGCNLGDFCTALEGVSHFNYVAWNAAHDKLVTLLELEMQAEIDKYVSARVLLARQEGGDIGNRLLERLFDDPAFDWRLAPDERRRYEDANRLAREYCHSLHSRFPARQPTAAMMSELRAFYRWAQPAKMSHIRAAVLS